MRNKGKFKVSVKDCNHWQHRVEERERERERDRERERQREREREREGERERRPCL